MQNKFFSLFILFISINLLSSCGGNSDSPEKPITPQNQAPLANAGDNQTINEQILVTLTGIGTDNDGTITTYQWQQLSGIDVNLSNTELATATFIAPDISQNEDLTFELTVTDNDGESHSDITVVQVLRDNQDPIAHAGEDTTVFFSETVVLDCNQSSDADGDSLTYYWLQISGEPVNLVNSSQCKAQFLAPNNAAELTFSLTVKDDYLGSSTDEVVVSSQEYTGQTNTWPDNHIAIISYLPEPFSDLHLIQDNKLFATSGSSMSIVDISNPKIPAIIGGFSFAKGINHLTVEGDYAFIASWDGITIFDISTPSQVTEVSFIGTHQGVTVTSVSGPYLFALNPLDNGNKALISIDISNIYSPKIVNSIDLLSGAYDISIRGNTAYITAADLLVYDISEPKEPKKIATLDINAIRIVINSDKAYLIGEYGLTILDIAIPESPKILSTFQPKWPDRISRYSRISIDDKFVYLETYAAIHKVDVSNPIEPFLAATLRDVSTEVLAQNGIIYSRTNVFNADIIPSLNFENILVNKATTNLNIQENTLYATNDNMFEVVDISTPSLPKLIGNFLNKPYLNEDSPIDSWAVQNGKAFLSTMMLSADEIALLHTLQIVDISEPMSISVIGNLDTDSLVGDFKIVGNYAYIVGETPKGADTYDIEFMIFDISSPLYPIKLGSIGNISSGFFRFGHQGDEMSIQNELAYISGDSLRIVDIANKAAPTLLNQDDSLQGHIKTIKNDLAFISNGTGSSYTTGFSIIDITDKTAPKRILSVDTSKRVTAISIKEDLAFVSDGNQGIKLYNIVNPSNPLLLKEVRTNGWVSDTKIKDNNIFIADSRGLIVSELDELTKDIITTEQDYHFVNESASLNYSVTWTTDKPTNIKCLVTSGTCTTIIDNINKAAQITWLTPDNVGDYEITILGGNTAELSAIHDLIKVQ